MKSLIKSVEKHRDLIIEAERHIWENPETGYREIKTSKYMEEKFEALGYDLVRAKDIPGFYTVLDTGKKGPEILILAELDSLICPNHKEADKETGYVHACGHNAQCAALLGIAAALKEEGATDKLCGKIKLCVVPAEELIEIGYRTELKNQGKIKYFGGKTEFLSRGYFDSSNIAFMVHASAYFGVTSGAVGCMAKKISYRGVSAHAGGSPWLGKNAIYAATQGLSAVNAIRETFKDEDIIRFHPIITHGGEAVNAIPELVTIEAYVRGKSFEAMIDANKKINRALCGAALSLGVNIDIEDTSGYAPLYNDINMVELTRAAAKAAIPEEEFFVKDMFVSGSTDMGDLSGIIPCIHPYAAGVVGKSHGDDYYIDDPEKACVKSVKLQLAMLYLLLENKAERANKIINSFNPKFKSIKEYLEYIDSISCSGERVIYKEDETAEVNLV